jgi:hypothetical protein
MMAPSSPVQAGRIIALSVLAGLIAGGILAAFNIVLLRPVADRLAESVIDELIADGEFDEDEFESRMSSAYFAQTAGSLVIGLAAGALIGGVYAFGGNVRNGFVGIILIAGAAWFVLYAVPAAKYPPSPLAMLDDEVGPRYYPLYAGYLVVSGIAALGIAAGFRKVARKNKLFGVAAAYLIVIAIAYFVFPAYDPDSSFDQSLLNSWRASFSAAMTALWFSTGGIAGLLIRYGSAKRSGK